MGSLKGQVRAAETGQHWILFCSSLAQVQLWTPLISCSESLTLFLKHYLEILCLPKPTRPPVSGTGRKMVLWVSDSAE